ncbi:MAG: hypothetical protein JWN40_2089 [Phycisphaerales bacterium]|nr:hypothetical protein [Phycisphaerales bacterium]
MTKYSLLFFASAFAPSRQIPPAEINQPSAPPNSRVWNSHIPTDNAKIA